MAEQTTNLGLKKPTYSEFSDVKDINDNSDIIDAAVKSDRDRLDAIEGWMPSESGANDQILRSNGDGTTRWDDAATEEEIGTAVTTWLGEHVDPTETAVIDDTLTVEHAAAEAKTTGDRISTLKSAISDIADEVEGVNFFAGYTEAGRIDNTNGTDATGNYVRSDYIPIDASNTTLYILRQTSPWNMRIFFYDANKTFISPSVLVFDSSTAIYKNNTSIPSNAAYVRTYRADSVTCGVEFSYTDESTFTPYAPPGAVLKDGIVTEEKLSSAVQSKINSASDVAQIETDLLEKKYVNFFNGTFPNSGYINTDGTDAVGSDWKRTNYIPIDNSKSKIYFLRTAQPYLLSLFFYDSTQAVIGTYNRIFTADATALENNISIPSTASYIRMYTSVSGYSGNLMLSYTEQDSFVEYGERLFLQEGTVSESNLDDALKAKVNSGLKLTGKTIAFMGDSIIGNVYDTTGVCEKLAEVTGATVINCAFGGSRMAYEYSAYGDASPTATGYNPGATDAQKTQVDKYRLWNAICGASLADAIASGTWTLQDTAVANMTDGLDYFADRLTQIKAIDWSSVDFIMWEYGTNDFMTKVVLDGNDMFAYNYAYRHAIETILTAYPNIRIITVTPTYRWYQSGGAFTDDSNTHLQADYAGTQTKLTDFVAMAETVSKEYQLPCIDDYYTLGANRYTRLSYFDSTDGTHPNANGRQRIAEHVGAQLMSLV